MPTLTLGSSTECADAMHEHGFKRKDAKAQREGNLWLPVIKVAKGCPLFAPLRLCVKFLLPVV